MEASHSTAPIVNVDPGTPSANDIPQDDSLGQDALPLSTSPSSNSLTPSARMAAVINKIIETPQSPTAEVGCVLVTDKKTGATHELSLEELRREYEDETVDRFLRVFSRQVHEVQMPEELPPDIPDKHNAMPGDTIAPPLDDEEASEEWRLEPEPPTTLQEKIVQTLQSPVSAVSDAASTVAGSTTQAAETVKENSKHTYVLLNDGEWHGRSPAEYIAMEWLVPYLPRPHRKTYRFTLGSMQNTISRLYLACQPLYVPFMTRMSALMMWEDPRKSFIYCLLFWVLWLFDMLLPTLFGRLTFALVRRRLLPAPTAQELVARQNASAQADVMGAEIRAYLDSNVTTGVGLKDAWRMFRLASKNKKQKAREMAEDIPSNNNDQNDVEWREDENSKRAVLAIMEEIADFHERFSNLAHWRDPGASTRYAIILCVIVLVSIFTPTKYVVKGTYAAGGFGFWFLPRIWLALPLEHRSRIPPPLADIPTDAEYAMDIISKRVERGQQVLPPELRKKDRKNRNNGPASHSTYTITPSSTFDKSITNPGSQNDEEYNMGDPTTETSKMMKFKAKVKDVVFADQSKRQDSLDENGEPLPEQTFPAKHHATMGMLCLNPTSLLFYPMMSSNTKVSIPLSSIRGVKKAGRMGGLRVKYVIPVDESIPSPRQSMDNASVATNREARLVSGNGLAIIGEPLEKEENFGWVSGRDEVFAKLVGWGGRRWVKM